jgi:hypothetical protein
MGVSRQKNQKPIVTIRGVVALAEWSDSDDDADVVVLTEEDEEYYIDTRESQIKPMQYVNSWVEVTGRVYDRDDYSVIEVKRIRIIDAMHNADGLMAESSIQGDFDDDVRGSLWADDDDVNSYARLIRGFRNH